MDACAAAPDVRDLSQAAAKVEFRYGSKELEAGTRRGM